MLQRRDQFAGLDAAAAAGGGAAPQHKFMAPIYGREALKIRQQNYSAPALCNRISHSSSAWMLQCEREVPGALSLAVAARFIALLMVRDKSAQPF